MGYVILVVVIAGLFAGLLYGYGHAKTEKGEANAKVSNSEAAAQAGVRRSKERARGKFSGARLLRSFRDRARRGGSL